MAGYIQDAFTLLPDIDTETLLIHTSETLASLKEIYISFLDDDDMLAMLVAEKPRVVSFHFGLPRPEQLKALRDAGVFLMATATNVQEAKAIEAAGIDAVVAQGYEAGGFKLFVWVLSAVLCGLAGALYVPQVGIINPSEMSPKNRWTKSTTCPLAVTASS